MKVLVLGFRQALCRSLEKRNIPYVLWSNAPVKSKLKSLSTIIADYPKERTDLPSDLDDITHVMAGTEAPVVAASLIRKWLDLKRNPHTLILRCTDKLTMKQYLSDKGIPMTKFADVRKCESLEDLQSELGESVVVKARNSSGGRGLEFVKNPTTEQFEFWKKNARKLDLYCEQAISGKEGSIESFIVDSEVVETNVTEYHRIGHCNLVPAHYSEKELELIHELNCRVIKALKIKWGMTHLEYYLTDEGILFGEVALRPPGGHIMDCMSIAYDVNIWDHFIDVELHQKITEPFKFVHYSGAAIFHPGEGDVESIDGVSEIESLPSLKKCKISVKPGDSIRKRIGVGIDIGYALYESDDPNVLVTDMDKSFELLKIGMKE